MEWYRNPILPAILLIFLAASLGAQSVNVAVLGFENLNRDPRYDYLEGMIIGVLMYDLMKIDDIELVERNRMDRIFEEQKLRLSGLLKDTEKDSSVSWIPSSRIGTVNVCGLLVADSVIVSLVAV